jgi:hypothetical protein
MAATKRNFGKSQYAARTLGYADCWARATLVTPSGRERIPPQRGVSVPRAQAFQSLEGERASPLAVARFPLPLQEEFP